MKYRIVRKVSIRWQPDYLRDGPGGLGWAFGSFDLPRVGTATIRFVDGGKPEFRQTCTEDEPECLPMPGDRWGGRPVPEPEPVVYGPGETDIPF